MPQNILNALKSGEFIRSPQQRNYIRARTEALRERRPEIAIRGTDATQTRTEWEGVWPADLTELDVALAAGGFGLYGGELHGVRGQTFLLTRNLD